MGGFPALLALALILATLSIIRGASGQDIPTDTSVPPATVATRITVGAFAFNFTAARCTNLPPRTLPNTTVQWTTAAAAKLPACESITFLTGPACTGVVAFSLAKPSSPTTYTSRTVLSYPYPLSTLCFIAGDAPWWPTEVPARVVVATAVAVGAYKVAFDPSSRCASVPAGTAPAGVATPVSVRWDAPCTTLAFYLGGSCSGAVLQLLYSSSSKPPSITPSSQLVSVRCSFSSSTACDYATCPANSVCAGTSDNRVATCKCDEGYLGINGTCQVKCNPDCMAINNTHCERDADRVPSCVCNKGFERGPNEGACVDKCNSVNCGPNGKCIKDANGNATCDCNTGFQMPPDRITCVDKCTLVTCTANSSCAKDANGNTRCDCIKSFERLPGSDACIHKCVSWKCGANSTCNTDGYGNPVCECNDGFQLSADTSTCVDTCTVLACEPDGTCVNNNGDRSCKWISPCGTCPPGAFCQTTRATMEVEADVPFCMCPTGYGMTATGCIQGTSDRVLASSVTLFQDRTAKGSASKPYTLRYNYGCNQFPAEVAGNFRTAYEVHNIDGSYGCRSFTTYRTDNCTSAGYVGSGNLGVRPMITFASQDYSDTFSTRSVYCG